MQMIEFTPGYQEHPHLNPLLWDGNDLRPQVRLALLKIAEEFRQFIGIDVPVIDVHITGGQVSYHYTDLSDLDLHLIIDYQAIDCDQEVEELLDTKRLLFKNRHSIEIENIPVEPGTEDVARPTVSAAWSIKTNSWVRPPKNYSGKIDHNSIKKQYAYWEKIIKAVLNQNDQNQAEKVLKLLRKYRKIGLKSTGEYGVENLVYKSLRNSNLLEKLVQYVDRSRDRELSIEPKDKARSAQR